MSIHARSVFKHNTAFDISHKLVKFESFADAKAYDEFLDDERYGRIYFALLAYGRYLDHRHSKIPVLLSVDEETRHSFQDAVLAYESRVGKRSIDPTESVQQIVEDITAESQMTSGEIEEIAQNLLKYRKEDLANFERAVNYVK